MKQQRSFCLLPLIFTLLCSAVIAGNQNNQPTTTAATDTTEAIRLNSLGKKWINQGELDSAIYYASRSLKLSSDLNYIRGIANAYHTIGKVHQRKNNHDKAKYYFNLALPLYQKAGDAKGIAITNNSIAASYFTESNFPKAFESYYTSLRFIEKIHDSTLMSVTLNNIGAIHEAQKNFPEALNFYTRSLALVRALHDTMRMGNILGNIGIIYDRESKGEKAFQFYNEAVVIAKRTQNKDLEAKMYSNISGALSEKGLNDSAVVYQLKALQIRQALGDEVGLTPVILNVGVVYHKVHKNTIALEYAHEAKLMARRLNMLSFVKESDWLLAEIYAAEHQYDKAYSHYRAYIALRDSLFNEENTKNMLRTEMNYGFEKKELAAKQEQLEKEAQARETQKRQERIIWTISFFLLLLAVIAFLVIRQFRYRNKEREMQLEQKLLRSQMNPHFIFNSLQAIQNFILQRNEKDAVRYLGSFASITRSVLENSRLELIPVRKELSLLENYLQLQKLRFGDKFTYSIEADETLEADEIFIPPMLSQPFIENALEHGMSGINEGGLIGIRFFVENDTLVMEIKDNGYGIGSKNQYGNHTSLATTITKERIELMNKKSSYKIQFDITEAYPNEVRKGVKVRFSIPLKAIGAR